MLDLLARSTKEGRGSNPPSTDFLTCHAEFIYHPLITMSCLFSLRFFIFCLLLSYTWSILSMSTSPSHPLVKLPHSRFSDKKLERGKCVLPWRSSSFFTFPSFLSSLSLSLSALHHLTSLFFCCEQSLHTQGPAEIKLHTHCCYQTHCTTEVTVKFDFRSWVFPYRSAVTLALRVAKTKIINNLDQ